MVIPFLILARRLPDGSLAECTDNVFFDFAVINALGLDHWMDTAGAGGRAAAAVRPRRKPTAHCGAARVGRVLVECGPRRFPPWRRIRYRRRRPLGLAADTPAAWLSGGLIGGCGR